MKVFVSYSRRDGVVTSEKLHKLDVQLQGVCKPFIHCLHDSGSRWEQVRVLRALIASHAILLVESPAASTSGWVRLELCIAGLLGLPLLRMKASELEPDSKNFVMSHI